MLLLPHALLDGPCGVLCLQVAGQARLMSQGLRRLAGTAAKSGATVMFINQLRNKVRAQRAPLPSMMA